MWHFTFNTCPISSLDNSTWLHPLINPTPYLWSRTLVQASPTHWNHTLSPTPLCLWKHLLGSTPLVGSVLWSLELYWPYSFHTPGPTPSVLPNGPALFLATPTNLRVIYLVHASSDLCGYTPDSTPLSTWLHPLTDPTQELWGCTVIVTCKIYILKTIK